MPRVVADVDVTATPEFRERPDRDFVFVRRFGPYDEQAPRAWEELHRTVRVADLKRPGHDAIGAAYDDPEKVGGDALRCEAGVTIDRGLRTPPGLQRGVLAGGRYAVFRYRGPFRDIGHAFDAAYARWVATTDVPLRPAPCLEIYARVGKGIPEAEQLTDLCFPVE